MMLACGVVGAVIGIGMSIVGAAFSISAAYAQADAIKAQGDAQQKIANAKAKNQRIQASQTLDSAEIEKQDQRRKARMQQAAGRVSAAGSGVMLEERDTAMANIWEQDVAAETAYDNSKIQHNAELQAWGLKSQANIDEYEGKVARDISRIQAKATKTAGWGQGISSVGSAVAGGASAFA
jgi:hypothetical protein